VKWILKKRGYKKSNSLLIWRIGDFLPVDFNEEAWVKW
jgi:hypothetical protein